MAEFLDNEGLTRFKDKMLAKVEEIVGASGGGNVELNVGKHNVGEEWHSYTGKIPEGGVPYCGQTVTRATYADLWTYVQNQGLVKTESEWQAWASSHGGNVPYYSSGDGSTTFRMPKIIGYLKGASSQSESGTYTPEGLPNITGTLGPSRTLYTTSGTSVPTDGAFLAEAIEGTKVTGIDGASTNVYKYTFDASRSNSVYGNSDHVTPETSVVLFGVYAFGEITNQGELDAETLATGLATVEANLETKLDEGDKEKIIGWMMPDWDSAVNISLTTGGFSYTPPQKGWLVCNQHATNNSSNLYVYRGSSASGVPILGLDGVVSYNNGCITHVLVESEPLWVDAETNKATVYELYYVPCKGA